MFYEPQISSVRFSTTLELINNERLRYYLCFPSFSSLTMSSVHWSEQLPKWEEEQLRFLFCTWGTEITFLKEKAALTELLNTIYDTHILVFRH